LRVKHPSRFKALLEGYYASHGDMKHPRMAALRDKLVNWLALTEADYEQLPAYMKTFSGSGPYRRIVTKPGFSYVAGSVFLPCNAARLRPNFETAFAYVGGWGAGSAGPAVDAGFQRSNLYDDYALFIRAQGFKQLSIEPRFPCGHTVAFRFYAASDTDLRLWAKGRTERGVDEALVANLKHDATYGWPAAGGGPVDGIVLKRMTTIGQSDPSTSLPDGTSWNADGSYFGHYANDKTPRIRWSNLAVGQVDAKGNPANLQPWGIAQTDATIGRFNYPNDPFNIWYSCTGCASESDAINLAK
jgi:hypothetical protein